MTPAAAAGDVFVVPERPLFELRHEAYPGMWVRVRPAELGPWLELCSLIGSALDADRKAQLEPEDGAALARLFEMFSDHLEAWNLHRVADGVHVPIPLTDVHTLDASFALDVVTAWFDMSAAARATAAPPDMPQEPIEE